MLASYGILRPHTLDLGWNVTRWSWLLRHSRWIVPQVLTFIVTQVAHPPSNSLTPSGRNSVWDVQCSLWLLRDC